MYHIIYIPKINKTQHPHYPQNCCRRSYWSLLVSSQHYPLGPSRIREIYKIYKVPLKEKSSQWPLITRPSWNGIWFRAAQGISEQCDATKRLTPTSPQENYGHEAHSKGLYTNLSKKELRRWGYYSPNSVAHMINYPPCNNFRCTTSRCFIHLHGSIAILPSWLLKHGILEVWERLRNPITKG